MDDNEAGRLAVVATEWFSAMRRALRLSVGDALAACGVRLHLFDGQTYSPALPVEPVNPEDFDTEEGLVVRETIEPTVLHDGRVLLRGKVVLERGR